MNRFIEVYDDGKPVLVNVDKIEYMKPHDGDFGTDIVFDDAINARHYDAEFEDGAGVITRSDVGEEHNDLWLWRDYNVIVKMIEESGAVIVRDPDMNHSETNE